MGGFTKIPKLSVGDLGSEGAGDRIVLFDSDGNLVGWKPNAESGGNINNSYSTTEALTGGTWIDGKPIYRRCFGIDEFTVDMSSSFPNSFALPNSTTDVSEIITIGGFYRDCGIFDCAENLQYNTIYNQGGLDKSVFIIQNSGYSSEPIIQFVNTAPTAQTLYGGSVLILEYTKTTDPTQ